MSCMQKLLSDYFCETVHSALCRHSGRAVDELRSELTQLDALHPTDAYELMVIDLLTK